MVEYEQEANGTAPDAAAEAKKANRKERLQFTYIGPDAAGAAALAAQGLQVTYIESNTPEADALLEYDKEIAARSITLPYTPKDILERHALQDAAEAQGLQVIFEQPLPETIPADALQMYLDEDMAAADAAADRCCPYMAALGLDPEEPCPKIDNAACCALSPGSPCPRQAVPYEERQPLGVAIVPLAKINQELHSLFAVDAAVQRQLDGRYSYHGEFTLGPNNKDTLDITDAERLLIPRDIAVMNALFTIVIDGRQTHTTADQILQALYMMPDKVRSRHISDFGNLSIEQVRDSIKVLGKTWIKINTSVKADRPARTIEGPMVPMVITTYRDQYGLQTQEYKLQNTCPLLEYCLDRRQIKRIDYKKLNAPRVKSKPSIDKAVIKDYIVKRIEAAANTTNTCTNSNIIDLKRMFRELQLGGPLRKEGRPYGDITGDQAYKDRKKIAAIMDSLKDDPEAPKEPHEGEIRSWEWIIEGRTYKSIKFHL